MKWPQITQIGTDFWTSQAAEPGLGRDGDLEGGAQGVHEELGPGGEGIGLGLKPGADVMADHQELPQLKVITRQKLSFLDSAKSPVTQLVTGAHLVTTIGIERVHFL